MTEARRNWAEIRAEKVPPDQEAAVEAGVRALRDVVDESGPRQLYAVEWTHDDGMDQHSMYAMLTPDEADEVRASLDGRGAVEAHVYEPTPSVGSADVLAEIAQDLPTDDDD